MNGFLVHKWTGYIHLSKLFRGGASRNGDTPWFFTSGREFGLWYLTVHAKWVKFEIIGPFRRVEVRP